MARVSGSKRDVGDADLSSPEKARSHRPACAAPSLPNIQSVLQDTRPRPASPVIPPPGPAIRLGTPLLSPAGHDGPPRLSVQPHTPRAIRAFMAGASPAVRHTPRFLRRGQLSEDSPTTAAARREQGAIGRDHRVRRRQGDQPSATPPLAELIRRARGHDDDDDDAPPSSQGVLPGAVSQGVSPGAAASQGLGGQVAGDGDGDGDPYFICHACGLARPRGLVDPDTGFCFYCNNASHDRDPQAQPKVCLLCLTTQPRTGFIGGDGEERDTCRAC